MLVPVGAVRVSAGRAADGQAATCDVVPAQAHVTIASALAATLIGMFVLCARRVRGAVGVLVLPLTRLVVAGFE
jgi:hypothetical protein